MKEHEVRTVYELNINYKLEIVQKNRQSLLQDDHWLMSRIENDRCPSDERKIVLIFTQNCYVLYQQTLFYFGVNFWGDYGKVMTWAKKRGSKMNWSIPN